MTSFAFLVALFSLGVECRSQQPVDSKPDQQAAAQKTEAAGPPPAPPDWFSDLERAKQEAKKQHLPLIVVIAEPVQTPASAEPLLKLAASKAVQDALNHEFIGLWHYPNPLDEVWQKHQIKKAPALLVCDSEGNLLGSPIEDVSEERFLRAVATAVEKTVPMHAELWIVKSDLSGVADAATIVQQLKSTYEEAQITSALVEKLPATASQLLFPPEVTMQYSHAQAVALKAWLKSRQILTEVRSAEPFRYRGMAVGGGGRMGSEPQYPYPLWSSPLTDAFSLAKLPDIALNGAAPVFVDRRVDWRWIFAGSPVSGVNRLQRSLNVNDHFRGQPMPNVTDTLDDLPLSLPAAEAVILNAFPLPTDARLREAMRQKGQEIVVAISRAPLEIADGRDGELTLPERVSPLVINRPQSKVYNWDAVFAAETGAEADRKSDSAGASDPPSDQPADEAISKSGKPKHYQTPNGWYSDFFEAAKAAQDAQLPVIMIVIESTGDALAQLKPAIELPALQQALGQQFIGVVAAVGPQTDLEREFEIKSTPAILAFDPRRKLIAGPTTDATPVTMANVLADVLKKVEPFHAELWFVKSDASQLPDANRIAVSVKALLARMKVQTPLADQLPKSATEILFPGGVSLQYTRENAGQLKAWLQRNRLLTRVEPLVDQDVTGLFTFVSTPGPVNVSMTAAVQPASILPLSIPFVADSRPQVKRRAEWWWLLNSEPFAPGFRDPAALRPGDASLTVELHINNYFPGQHAPKTDKLLERFGMRLPHAEVVMINSFKRNGVSEVARSADEADENAIVVITPSHWRSEKTNEFAPLPTLSENVTPLKAENTVDQLANYIASVDSADNNAPGDGDHSLQVARDVAGGEQRTSLPKDIAEEEAKLAKMLEDFGPNHPATRALEERLEANKRSLETSRTKASRSYWHGYQHSHASAESLIDLLSTVFPDKAIEVVKNPGVYNGIRVKADGETQRRVLEILNTLPTTPVAPQTTLKIIAFKNVRASDLVRNLKQLFGGEPTEIVADERSNSLLVRATPETSLEIEAVVAKLDSAPEPAAKETRSWPFDREAKAEWLRNRIQSVTGEKKLAENKDQAEFNRLGQVELQARYALRILSGDSAPADDAALQKALQIVEGLDRPKPELASVYEGREHRAGELANRVKAGVPAQEAERLRAEVSQTVNEAFAARQSLLRAELAELRSRLQVLERTIETRDKLQSEIVKKRVDDLLNPDLKWDRESSDELRSKSVTGSQPGRGAASQSPSADEQVIYVEGQNGEPGHWIRNPKPSEYADAALEPREVGVVQSPREAADIRISLARADSVKLHEWLVVRTPKAVPDTGGYRQTFISIATIEVVDVQPDHAIAHVIGFNRVRSGNSYQNQSPAEGDVVYRARKVAIQSDGDVRDSHFNPAQLHDSTQAKESPGRDQNRGGSESSGRMGPSGRMGGTGFGGGRRSSRDAASYERRIAGVISEVKGNDQISVSLAARDSVKPGDRLNVAETTEPSQPPAGGPMTGMMTQRSAAAGMSLARPVATIEVVSAQGDTAVCKVITINRVREENRYVDKLPEPGDTVLFLTKVVRESSSGGYGAGSSSLDDLLKLGVNPAENANAQVDPVNKPPVSHETIGIVSEAADAANITVSLARRNIIKVGDQLVAVDGAEEPATMSSMGGYGTGGFGMGPMGSRTPPRTELATLQVTKLDDGTAICRVKAFTRVREGNAYVDKLPKPGDGVLFVTGIPTNADEQSKLGLPSPSAGVIVASADDVKRVAEHSSQFDFEHVFRVGPTAVVISAPDSDQITVSLANPATVHPGEVFLVQNALLQIRDLGDQTTSAIQVSSVEGNRAVCKVLKFRLIRYDGEYREIMPTKGDSVIKLRDLPLNSSGSPTPPAESRTLPEQPAPASVPQTPAGRQ